MWNSWVSDKDEATTYNLELIMLGAVQLTKEASHAIGASELVDYWVWVEVVVLWVEIRVGVSHAIGASELAVCSPVLASSTTLIKNRICPEEQAGQHDILSEGVLGQVLVGCNGGVHLRGGHLGRGLYGCIGGDHLRGGHLWGGLHGCMHDCQETVHGQGQQCGGGQGGLDEGYIRGLEGGELIDQYEGSSTFLSSPDVAHVSVLAAEGSCQLFGAGKLEWAGVASYCASCGNNCTSVTIRTQ